MKFILFWRENSTNEWVREGQFDSVTKIIDYIDREPTHKGEFVAQHEDNPIVNVVYVNFES